MRYFLLVPALIAVTACGGERSAQPPGDRESLGSVALPTETDVPTNASPGVAFNYRYTFQLAPERVADAQNAHAAACEKLGIARCRITGMSYQSSDDEVEASLELRLDPAFARQFGKDSVDTIVAAEGKVLNSAIAGEDAGGEIGASNRAIGGFSEDLRKTEALLAAKGLTAEDRARLEEQAQKLREAIRSSEDTREDRAQSLAATPMAFDYRSGYAGSPIRQALRSSLGNVTAGLSILIVLAVLLGPWLVIAGLVVWLIRRFRPKPSNASQATPPDQAAA
jgi:hypothetical protein